MDVSILNLVPDPNMVRVLNSLHSTLKEKKNQSIRYGTEFTIKECGYKVIQKNMRLLQETIDNGMEFIGIWSSLIPSGGYRVKHHHPQGKVSGCWYLDIDEASPLYFEDGQVLPNEGDIVLFPSYLVHWVEKSPCKRLTIAFDMVDK